MESLQSTIAYIDWANIHRGSHEYGWEIDFLSFRIFLRERYKVAIAYVFTGFVENNTPVYKAFERAGFEMIFKEVSFGESGSIKGNCDADLVLKATSDFYVEKRSKVILVSGDGDFTCLVKFFTEKGVFDRVLAPHPQRCSFLLKKYAQKITFMNDIKGLIEVIKEKAPGEDETSLGSFS